MKKEFTEVQNIEINLAPFGGRDMTVDALFKEVRRTRRDKLMDIICHLASNDSTNLVVFDGITFNALIEDYTRGINNFGDNFEGEIEY